MRTNPSARGFILLELSYLWVLLPALILITFSITNIYYNQAEQSDDDKARADLERIKDEIIKRSNVAADDDNAEPPAPISVDHVPANWGVPTTDPAGIYYRYCTWGKNSPTPPAPGLVARLIAAGQNHRLETQCSDTGPSNDIILDIYSSELNTYTRRRAAVQSSSSDVVALSDNMKFGIGVSSPKVKLHTNGMLVVGDDGTSVDGSISYRNHDFVAYTGGRWFSLTTGGDAAPNTDFVCSPLIGNSPLTISCSNKSQGIITSATWDFGDGLGSVTYDSSHTYNATGIYTVKLVVSGPGGTTNSTKTNYIMVFTSPSSSFTATPNPANINTNVLFHSTSGGDIATCAWDFGDNSPSTNTCADQTHSYSSKNVYQAKLSLAGVGGGTSTSLVNVNIFNPVLASFTISNAFPTLNSAITTTNTTSGDMQTCSWAWGDGQISTGCGSQSHAYATTGAKTITLTVQGQGGGTSSASVGLTAHSYSWLTGPWGTCSGGCSDGQPGAWQGSQSRTVTCKRNDGSIVDDNFCLSYVGSKPALTQACNATDQCSYGWQTGNWGGCSGGCTDAQPGWWYGSQSRSVTCNRANGVGNTIADFYCGGGKPNASQPCSSTDQCSYYYGGWGSNYGCSAACGGGTDCHDRGCLRSNGVFVDCSYCGGQCHECWDCNTQSCGPTCLYQDGWHYSAFYRWGSCSWAAVNVFVDGSLVCASTNSDCSQINSCNQYFTTDGSNVCWW